MNPLLSIIIAVYNNENTLNRCIDSFYNYVKNNDQIEVICIDDHSTDNSLKIIGKYEPIKVYTSYGKGLSASRNTGISKASGKYIWFIDADDELVGKRINDSFLKILNVNNADMYLLGVEKIKGNNKQVLVNKQSKSYQLRKSKKNIGQIFHENIINNSWNKIYRRQTILDNKLSFDSDVSSVEDILFNIKYFKFTKTLYTVNKIFYRYFIYSKTSTKWRYAPDMLDASLKLLQQLLSFYDETDLIDKYSMSKITIDLLIGNEINLFAKNRSETFFKYQSDWLNSGMSKLKDVCMFSYIDIKYLIKYFISSNTLLSYFYIKTLVSRSNC